MKSSETVSIAFLRGINVSGKNIIRMADLANMFSGLGFTGVQTYIQSGNIVFCAGSALTRPQLTGMIAEGIFKRFGFRVPVTIRSAADLRSIVAGNPFTGGEETDSKRFAVILLSAIPAADAAATLNTQDHLPDRCICTGDTVYAYCPNGLGQTKLTTAFFEKKLSVTATARNWNTIQELLRISETVAM